LSTKPTHKFVNIFAMRISSAKSFSTLVINGN